MLGSVTPDTAEGVGGALVPLWPSVEGFCAGLAGSVAGQVDDVAEAMLDEIRLKIDAYAGLSDAELACVRDGLRATEALFLAVVAEGREVSADEVAVLEAVGEQRAAQGVPLAALQEAVAVATRVGYDHLHDQAAVLAGRAPGAVDLGAVSRHLSLHACGFNAKLGEAFRLGYVRGKHRRPTHAESDLFDALLFGGLADEAEIRQAAARAGLALGAPCAVLVLVPLEGGACSLERGVAVVRPALPGAAVSPVSSHPCVLGHHHQALADHPWDGLLARLDHLAAAAGLVVVAEYAPSLDAVGPTYQAFRRRLVVTPRLRRPAVLRPVHLTTLWFANVLDTAERFLEVDRVLGATLGRRPDWARADLDALGALRDGRGSRYHAARLLHITPNAMRRRLRSVEDRTGLSLDNPTDVAMLGQALSLYWCDSDTLPPLGDARWGQAPVVTSAPPPTSREALG